MITRLRRAASGPVPVAAALVLVAAAVPILPQGAVLAWLLLGLTAGYALSGSA